MLRAGIAAPLEANLESTSIMRADSSIWESHQPGKHYAYTTLAAARGFCDMAAISAKAGKHDDTPHYQELAGRVRAAIASTLARPSPNDSASWGQESQMASWASHSAGMR